MNNTKERKVMIATPCHDHKLPVEYVGALLDTMRAGLALTIAPVFLPGESILPHARNALAKIFLDSDFDTLIYIDADMVWAPEQFAKIVFSENPVISGIAHLKRDNSPFNFRILPGEKPTEEGLLSVESIGCAFMKLDRKAVEAVSKASSTYIMHNTAYSNIFEYSMDKDEFVGEDLTFCRKLRKKKYKILADMSVVIGHIGSKIY